MRKYKVELTLTTDDIPDEIDDSDVVYVLQRDIQNHLMSLHSIVKGTHFNKYVNRDDIELEVLQSNGEPPF